LIQNIKLYYNFGVRTILRHRHKCPKVKTNFATCPKLGHGREHDLGLRFVLRHVLFLRHFREHGPWIDFKNATINRQRQAEHGVLNDNHGKC
jgi:hypothetical protein